MDEATDIQRLLSQPKWNAERRLLREVLLRCGLGECVKWSKLCYTIDGANVALIYGMKDHCAIGYFKGALLSDPQGLLVAPGQHSQAMRQLRFRDLAQIERARTTIVRMTEEAVSLERQGARVSFPAKVELTYPSELLEVLREDAAYGAAFEALSAGRRRGYVIHFAHAKQAETRRRRIARARERVLQGKGPNDR